MEARAYPDIETPLERFLRLSSLLRTGLQVVVNRFLEGLTQRGNVGPLIADQCPDKFHPAIEEIVHVTEMHRPVIILVEHHVFHNIPSFFKVSAICSIWYRLSTGVG